jgi:hypothetical protein
MVRVRDLEAIRIKLWPTGNKAQLTNRELTLKI